MFAGVTVLVAIVCMGLVVAGVVVLLVTLSRQDSRNRPDPWTQQQVPPGGQQPGAYQQPYGQQPPPGNPLPPGAPPQQSQQQPPPGGTPPER